MKKVFKIIGITLIIIIILIGLFIGGFYLKEILEKNKLNNERINSKTLSEYIEYHDQKHTRAKDNTINFLEFSAKNIKCDLLDTNKILYYTRDENNGILILDDYSIYATIFGSEKLYSNNQQYKKIDLGIDIKGIQIQYDQIYLISTDNKYYSFNNYSLDIEELPSTNGIEYNLLKDENIKKIVRQYTNSETGYNEYTIIKNDGQVYLQEYKYLNYTSFVKESILISKDKYGSISDLDYDIRIYNSANSTIEYKDICITKIVSDNGLYYLKPLHTEDSKKYVDIEPTYEMSKSDIYSKYEEDVLFINCDFVFTKDKNIILTNYLCNELDKDIIFDNDIADLNSHKITETNQSNNEPIVAEKTESNFTNNSNSQAKKNNNFSSSNNKTNNKNENKEISTNSNVENKENTTNTNTNIENNNKQETEEKKEEFITIKKIWMENDGGQFSIGDKVVIHAIVDSKYELKSIAMAVISDVNSASKHADQVSVTQNNTEYHYTYHLEITDEFIPGLWRYQCSVFQDKYSTRGEDLNNKFKFSFTVI